MQQEKKGIANALMPMPMPAFALLLSFLFFSSLLSCWAVLVNSWADLLSFPKKENRKIPKQKRDLCITRGGERAASGRVARYPKTDSNN